MKKTIYLILLLIICLNCSSTKTFTKKSDIKAIVENRQLNILYRGVQNHLNIDIPQSDSIQVSGAGVKKDGKNRYSIVPTTGTTLEIPFQGLLETEWLPTKENSESLILKDRMQV
ncbi:GldM family protein [Chryseobacterium sp. Leaf313]|uniref:GldM family protein n=1 Tax=Chryseobacterium sp. Leaf313 TaxID=2876563 RepID=UPI001E40420F|nr:GldM family protein [Chryseobacterium sp. Leaf313]